MESAEELSVPTAAAAAAASEPSNHKKIQEQLRRKREISGKHETVV